MEHVTGLVSNFWNFGIVFLLVLTVVVFIHELGHYLVARWNGVRIEVFSVGFGKELWGWTDKAGTRWRISLLPLGGYVKMFGDADATSSTGADVPMTPEEQAVSFHHKRVGQRAAIVFAGPAMNFIFGILVLALLFMFIGQPQTPAVVGAVTPDSPAATAGLQPGDKIVEVNGQPVRRFQDVQKIVRLGVGEPLDMLVVRDGREISLHAQPRVQEIEDNFGNKHRAPVLGVRSPEADTTEIVRHGPVSAVVTAVGETYTIVETTMTALGQMIAGTRDAEELGGPLRIAKGAGQAAQMGIISTVVFMVLISINLGLINLFPIPLLDGGHLAFYAVEAARGRPLSPRAQEYGFRVGMFLVLALMIFATRNDLLDLGVFEFVRGLIS